MSGHINYDSIQPFPGSVLATLHGTSALILHRWGRCAQRGDEVGSRYEEDEEDEEARSLVDAALYCVTDADQTVPDVLAAQLRNALVRAAEPYPDPRYPLRSAAMLHDLSLTVQTMGGDIPPTWEPTRRFIPIKKRTGHPMVMSRDQLVIAPGWVIAFEITTGRSDVVTSGHLRQLVIDAGTQGMGDSRNTLGRYEIAMFETHDYDEPSTAPKGGQV